MFLEKSGIVYFPINNSILFIMLDIIEKFWPYLTSIAFPLFLIILAIRMRLLKGSSMIIMNKLWSTFIGEKAYYNKQIEEFSNERHDIEKFNATNNFNFKKIEEITCFLTWIKDNNLNIDLFSNLGGYFNHTNFSLKKVSKSDFFWMWLLFIFSISTLIAFITLYFQMKIDYSNLLHMAQSFNIHAYILLMSISSYLSFQMIRLFRKVNKNRVVVDEFINKKPS